MQAFTKRLLPVWAALLVAVTSLGGPMTVLCVGGDGHVAFEFPHGGGHDDAHADPGNDRESTAVHGDDACSDLPIQTQWLSGQHGRVKIKLPGLTSGFWPNDLSRSAVGERIGIVLPHPADPPPLHLASLRTVVLHI
ncbi:MAG: hypothetical protein GC164_13190 [Phycisphaera sp.]|nr:hypothetical protein [Phycisphaera sp.]